MVMGWVAVLLMVVAVAARGLGFVSRPAGLGVRVAGLGARVANDLLTGARVGLDCFFMLLGWVAMLLMLVTVAARGIDLVFCVAGLDGRVAGLGARVAKHRFDWCCARAWIGFPWCWARSLCW